MSVVVVSAFVFVDLHDLVVSFSSGMGFTILQMVETEELEVLFALKLHASLSVTIITQRSVRRTTRTPTPMKR